VLSEVEERLAAALEEQLRPWRAAVQAGAERVGWKIGLGIPEVEELMGAEPVLGHLTSATRLESGATWSARGAAVLRAETEVAVEVGPDGAVTGLGTALELVDLARPPHGFEGIVAANVFHRAFVLGPSRTVAPGERPEARLSVNGRLRDSGRAPTDFAGTVRTVARLLALVGERLEPGDRIIAGSLTHVPVGPGDDVVVEVEGLGNLRVAIEA
jgi:2-keto-4-pentenoate hydratase